MSVEPKFRYLIKKKSDFNPNKFSPSFIILFILLLLKKNLTEPDFSF